MKLYIRQKKFSWTDQFSVTDEYGDPRYYIRGQIFSLGKRLRVHDESGEEIAVIQEELFRFQPRYRVMLYGSKAAEIVKKRALMGSRYKVQGPDWEIEGSIWNHNYRVTHRGRTIASIHKAWLKWGDYYELEIDDPANKLLALAVVLTIDCVAAAEERDNGGEPSEN